MDQNKPSQNLPTRDNNPGDLRNPATGSFETYNNPQEGFSALLNDLQAKIDGKSSTGLNGNSTLDQFSQVYAPSSDKNDPGKYTASLANQLGVSPDSTLSSLQPKIGQFAEAVAHNEGYQGPSSIMPSGGTPDPAKDLPSSDPANGLSPLAKLAIGAGVGAGAIGLTAATGGLDLLGAGVAGLASTTLPEFALPAIVGGETLGGGTVGGAIGSTLGGAGVLGLARGILGGKGASNKATEQAASTEAQGEEDAGQEEAQATQNAATNEDEEQETQADISRAQQASAEREQEILQQANSSPVTRAMVQDPNYQSAVKTLSQNGIPINNNSGYISTIQGVNQIGNEMSQLNQNRNETTAASGISAPAQALKQELYSDIDNQIKTKQIASDQKQEAYAMADEMVARQSKAHADENGNMRLASIGKDGTVGGFAATRDDGYMAYDASESPLRNKVRRAMGRAANEVIKKKLPKEHSDLYEKTNKKMKDLVYAKKLLEKMHNKKIGTKEKSLSHKLFSATGRAAAIYVGEKLGGVWGAIVGEHFGDKIVRSIDKKMGKQFFESPAGQKAVELIGKDSKKMMKEFGVLKRKYGIKEAQVKIEKEMDVYKKQIEKSLPAPSGKPLTKEPVKKPDFYVSTNGVIGNKQEVIDAEGYKRAKRSTSRLKTPFHKKAHYLDKAKKKRDAKKNQGV